VKTVAIHLTQIWPKNGYRPPFLMTIKAEDSSNAAILAVMLGRLVTLSYTVYFPRKTWLKINPDHSQTFGKRQFDCCFTVAFFIIIALVSFHHDVVLSIAKSLQILVFILQTSQSCWFEIHMQEIFIYLCWILLFARLGIVLLQYSPRLGNWEMVYGIRLVTLGNKAISGWLTPIQFPSLQRCPD
jgi:hypothetical protein